MKNVFGGSWYANVTATLAFIVALGGTSYAAGALPINSIGSAQIKPNGVASSDIASNAVNSAKVKDWSLKSRDFAAGQIPKGPTGATGPAGPAGATGTAGAAGAAGTARAYAHVNADGTLDAANSKGVTASLLGTNPGGTASICPSRRRTPSRRQNASWAESTELFLSPPSRPRSTWSAQPASRRRASSCTTARGRW